MQNEINIMDLVKYDPAKGAFVLKPQEQQIEYWPGTGIQKSKHNVFNWQGKPSRLTQAFKGQHTATPSKKASNFTIFSKAYKAR